MPDSTATPNHKVHTLAHNGWLTFRETTRNHGANLADRIWWASAIRLGEDRVRSGGLPGTRVPTVTPCPLRVRGLWIPLHHLAAKLAGWANQRLHRTSNQPPPQYREMVVATMTSAAKQRCTNPRDSRLARLWRSRDCVPVRDSEGHGALDRGAVGGARQLPENGTGSHRQRRALRTRKSPVGVSRGEHQHAGGPPSWWFPEYTLFGLRTRKSGTRTPLCAG